MKADMADITGRVTNNSTTFYLLNLRAFKVLGLIFGRNFVVLSYFLTSKVGKVIENRLSFLKKLIMSLTLTLTF